jgi:hypothetical protein
VPGDRSLLTAMRRLLISHSWSAPESHTRLTSLLARRGYEFFDHSVLKEDPLDVMSEADLRHQLADRISHVSTVVVAATEDAHKKRGVRFEIEEAVRAGKRIVAVKPLGLASAPIPKIIDQYADAIVGFRAENIVAAIEGEDIRNLSSYLIAEDEDVRRLAHWISRSAAGVTIVGALTHERWLPKVDEVLQGLGYGLSWKEAPPAPQEVFRNVLIGAGIGLVMGLLGRGRWPATLALAGGAAGGLWTIGRRLMIERSRDQGRFVARYSHAPGLLPI